MDSPTPAAVKCPPVSILIPAYNEAACIQETIDSVRKIMDETCIPYEIIVINDGSADETAERAGAAGVTVLNHPANGGYGLSLKTGIRRAKYDWCAIIDADATYPVKQLPELLSYIPDFDMVVGARTGKFYQGSRWKQLGRTLLSLGVDYVVGQHIPDVNSGMRVFRKEIALAHARRISAGFSFTTTITLAMFLEHHFVRYVPIEYYPRIGKSKVKMGKDALRMMQIVSSAFLYYNPLKLFLFLCFLTAFAGLIFAVILALVASIQAGLEVLALFAVATLLIGALGFLAEAMRLNRHE
jgi:glycosyltransferase involved in cell wall biosynthesis